MKKIIIISHGNTGKATFTEIFGRTSGEYDLLYAPDGREAAAAIAGNDADIILYDLSSFPDGQMDNLSMLTARFPYIPCITILDEEGKEAESTLRSGVSKCLIQPVNGTTLLHHLKEQIQLSTSGQVRGIPVHSLLQMLESEAKTCTLKIESRGRTGLIFIKKGRVIAAETVDQENEEAMHTLITWEEPLIQIRYFNGRRTQKIDKPLISLIMGGLHYKDGHEQLLKEQSQTISNFKHLWTSGNRIALDIGIKVKMEFDEMEAPLVCTMVGMLPEEYLIVTTPTPFAVVRNALESGNRIVVKYLHMGRLCMFKAQCIKAIEDPYHLLFLDFPPVIYYQELRRAKRASIFIPCTLHPLRGAELYGVLIDLSSLGCLCQIKMRNNAPLPTLDIGAKIQLRCLLPGLKEDQELTAVVKNLRKSTAEAQIGLEFADLQAYLKEAIENYIYSFENSID